MRLLTLASFAISAAVFAVSASAATLLDQFTFTTDTSADIGGATATGSGTVGSGRYNFAADQGLSVSLGTTLSSWSVAFSGQIDENSGYRKLIDLSGLASDNGLYNLNGYLNYYNAATGPTQTISPATDFTAILTFDGTTTRGFVNGVQQFSFAVGGAGYPSSLSSLILFEDDIATGQREASGGSMDWLQIYNGALNSDEVGRVGPVVSTVPLPATAPLLMAALAGFGALRRRKS